MPREKTEGPVDRVEALASVSGTLERDKFGRASEEQLTYGTADGPRRASDGDGRVSDGDGRA